MHLTIKGIRVHVQEPREGGGEREPSLLFLHGAGGDADIWEDQAGYFSGKHRAYLLELPGHGLSSGAGEEEIAAYAGWVHGILESGLPPHSWVLVGHSMGGAVALQLALDHPSSLKAMVLVGTGAKLGVLPVILKLLEDDPEAFFKTIDLAAFCSSTPAEIREISSRSIRRCPPQVILKDFRACNRFDLRSRLQEINTPALIVCGVNDRLAPVKYSEFLHQNLRSSKLVLIPDSAHMVMAEKPDLFNETLKTFLDEINATSRETASLG